MQQSIENGSDHSMMHDFESKSALWAKALKITEINWKRVWRRGIHFFCCDISICTFFFHSYKEIKNKATNHHLDTRQVHCILGWVQKQEHHKWIKSGLFYISCNFTTKGWTIFGIEYKMIFSLNYDCLFLEERALKILTFEQEQFPHPVDWSHPPFCWV